MPGTDPLAAARALSRAVKADDRIWTTQHDSTRHRRTRDDAVAEALRSGMSKEQLADELGVLISDVDRMAATADAPPAPRSAIDGSLRL